MRAGLVSAVITPYFCVCSDTERLGVQPEHQTMWFFTESVIPSRASREDLKGSPELTEGETRENEPVKWN